ncbi:MarR family transcriptional regulator [Sphingomonas sp. So64.6b]|uniref:MarR family winged helix-turn-helix transcriptional regulator n=1 Tax=Sphingomonas sp. So64.6b TaxID=2997354 RepID=UPI001601D299|nr:MarR family transcriptional regulator [Sphingomonas sp. So64.6b]QNA86588.1 MarR family transcriptional regulator [Sphingomonas sp. So64.6b]
MPRAKAPSLDQLLCFSLYGASMAINRAYKPLLDELGITYPQYLVLNVLWERGEDTIGSIAERLALESSTVTPLVKRLEQAGLVERRRNPADERQVVVTATPAGVGLQAKSHCLGELLFAAAGLPVEKLIELNRQVQAFRDSVSEFAAAKS